jgi:ABC-type dipeptide/oligopeptide/nickel transport system permease component
VTSSLARLARALFTVWAAITLVFFVVRSLPGDPATAILGDGASPEERAALRESLLLDRPLPAQYAAFFGTVLDGTLGHTFRDPDRTVARAIGEAYPHTLVLAGTALVVAWLVALPLGTLGALGARRPTRLGVFWDRLARGLSALGSAVPAIVLGPCVILVFAVLLRLLPMPGDEDAGVLGLVLPAGTIGLGLAAGLTRQTRAQMLEKLAEPYVMAARARGLSETQAAFRHALRNAALPLVTLGTAQLGALLSGSVIVERLFERPGLGTLLIEAFGARDIPVVQGATLVVALTWVLANVLGDLLLAAIDPRTRSAA